MMFPASATADGPNPATSVSQVVPVTPPLMPRESVSATPTSTKTKPKFASLGPSALLTPSGMPPSSNASAKSLDKT